MTGLKQFVKWAWDALSAPVEYVLNPSLARFRIVGIFAGVGQLSTYFLWTALEPQPFDNFWLRLGMSLIGVPFMLSKDLVNPFSKKWQILASMVCWAELPAFMTLMFFANGRNNEWLVCLCAMPLIYYHMTDWRIATVGIASAWGIGLFCQSIGWWSSPQLAGSVTSQILVFLFCWTSAIGLRISAANVRKEQTAKTQETIMYLAHELRTPLSAISMVSDQLDGSSDIDAERSRRLGDSLTGLTAKMHGKIDRILYNSSVNSFAVSREIFDVVDVVRDAINDFGLTEKGANEIVQVISNASPRMEGERYAVQFAINNLLTNAYSSLLRKDQELAFGDVQVVIESLGKNCILIVKDSGVGIDRKDLGRVFEPYFTTAKTFGLGLGMTYCQAVAKRHGGRITIASSPGQGARVEMTFPAYIDRAQITATSQV